MPEVTYDVNVTPRFDGLTPVYETTLYQWVKAGICGPFGEIGEFNSLEDIDQGLFYQGWIRVGEFGPVCRNGFATAMIVPRTK